MSFESDDDGKAVLINRNDGIAEIQLNQPKTRNALSSEIVLGLRDAIDTIEQKNAVRGLVLTGNGGVFSAGGDISAMGEDDESSPAESAEQISRSVIQLIRQLANCPLPTIAKIEGPAFGAGGAVAIACDVRVASDNAEIGFGFRQVGLTIDSGISYFLPRIVGLGTAKTLVFTGDLIDAERAYEIGLFDRVYDAEHFDSHADSFISQIAEGPTLALSNSKHLLNHGVDRSFDDALRAEATAQANVLGTYDHTEGLNAFFEEREPQFQGR